MGTEFWKHMLQAHRRMDKRLEELWCWRAGGCLAWSQIMSTSVAILSTFVCTAASPAGTLQFGCFASLCAISLVLLMLPLWQLSRVTAACQSTWAGSDSILRRALAHGGRDDRQQEAELQF